MTTVVAAVVVAIVCAVVFATTGRSAIAEQTVLSSVDSAGTRLLTVADNDGTALMSAQSVSAISSLEGVDWVIGLGPVVDMYPVTRPISGTGVSTRQVYGNLDSAVELIHGRPAVDGVALMGKDAATKLGFLDGVGGIRPDERASGAAGVAVTGTFQSPVVTTLDSNVLIQSSLADGGELRYLYIQAATIADMERLPAAVAAALVVGNPAAVTVAAPTDLINLRASIASGLGTQARLQMLLILGVGLVLVLVTMIGGTASRRKDFGRRRALGASRSAIVLLVVVQATMAGCIGVIIGTVVGLTVTRAIAGSIPSITFVMGVAVLAVLSAIVAAVPPALAAAYQDPVRILRVP